MKKIRIAIFLILISVNYLAGKCVEESSANEEASEILEKSELFAADANEQVSKTIETESREDSPNKNLESINKRAEFDDLSESVKTENSRKEKSANDEVTNERKPKDLEKSNGRRKSADSLEEESDKSGKTKKQLEELPNISKSATEIEEKKAEDLSEASAESKLSDNEMTSSPIFESDRMKAKSGELKEKTNDLGLHEIIATRRMLSKPNVILDIKARSEEDLSLEDKTAHVPTINANNNFEFGSGSSKLINRAHAPNQKNRINPQPITDPNISLNSFTPETKRVENQKTPQHINLPQLYPESRLNLDFPVFDLQQHEPRGVPIYLELEQDQEKFKNNIMEAQRAQRCNTRCVPRQFHQSQNNLDSSKPLLLNQLRNIDHEGRNRDQQFQLNQRSINLNNAAENRYMENLFHNTKNRNQQFKAQEKINSKTPLENNHFEDLSVEPKVQIPLFHQIRPSILPSLDNINSENLDLTSRNQVQLLQNARRNTVETKQIENLDERRNQIQQFRQAQTIINPNMMSSENKAFENFSHEKYVFPFPNFQLLKNPLNNIMKAPAISYDATSGNIKSIFQTLAEATGYPKKLTRHLQAPEIKQTYPNAFNLNNGGSFPYHFNFLPRFK